MYDTERIRCAKMFLDLLSEGVDPITNEDVTENTLKTPEVIACLKYVSEILAEKIDTSVQKISDKSKSEFFITEEQKRQLNPISDMINVSSITAEINRITANNECRKLKAVSVNDWLESIGLLRVSELGSRTATESGNDIGIKSELRTSNEGRMYYANSYNEDAQRFIYENISVIANFVSEGNESVSKTKRVIISIP